MKKTRRQIGQQFVLPVAFAWMELVFHIAIYRGIDRYIVYPVLFAMAAGFLLSVIIGCFHRKVAKVLVWVVLSLALLLFIVQAVYFTIFKTYLTIFMLGNAGDATQFWKEGLGGAWKAFPALLVLALPLIAYAIMRIRGYHERKIRPIIQLETICMMLIVYSAGILLFQTDTNKETGLKYLYYDEWQIDRGVQQMGVFTGLLQDVKLCLTYEEELDGNVDYVGLPSITVGSSKPSEPEATRPPDATCTPTPTPVDTSPQVVNIDFDALAAAEDDSTIKEIHEYMSASTPTNKNEYTGMFEGYNLIMMTCEGFSPWAVDENVTPTLYKLVHEGFDFTNFYNPIWITSTSDGEYVECMGLLPDLKKNNSFKRSANNALPYCFGNRLAKLGYSCRAYHDNSYTYYGRDKTHPNMGYSWKAVGNGLEISKAWPESDLEMMEQTIPEYINDSLFHTYYMTVSGHLEYTFNGNSMAKKNKDAVADLPYSDECKAYIACNVELDKACEYLINELEKAGVADKTLIVMSGDHYPYGLTIEQIEELNGGEVDQTFELYRNNLIIWSASMKEPVVVDKICSTLDIMPTVNNLLGVEYDSRLYMGSDIFSTAASLVMFKDSSFITDYCKYNAGNGKTTMLAEVDLPENYISTVKAIVKNKFSISRAILNNNYYKYVEKYLP